MNKMDLKEWTIQHIKHKDIITKSIQQIEEHPNSIKVTYKDKEQHFYFTEQLNNEITEKAKKQENKTIVCLMKKENINHLVNNWKEIAAIKNLWIIFIDLETHHKVIINPYVHNSIADQATLKQGINSLFENS